MLIKELKDGNRINLEVKIIWDLAKEYSKFGNRLKTVIVVDKDNATSVPSAFLTLKNEDINNFKFQDKIRIINCYAKQSKNKKGQFRIWRGNQIGRYEKIA